MRLKVMVTGGTGFVGKGIIDELVAAGHQVVCLVRPDTRQKLTVPAEWQEQVVLHTGDLLDREPLNQAMNGCEAVIHLVGIIREVPKKQITFSRVHVAGTKQALEAAKQAGVNLFVHMSALGAREGATSGYHRSKFLAEQAVIASGIPYTIFRPSVIFGPGDEFVNMLADLVKMPITPVIGDGSYRLQPVSRKTVAEVFTQSLTLPSARNQIFEVGGPEQLSYSQILDEIGQALGKPHVRKLHFPLALMKPIVTMMEGFPFFPITNTQLTMLLEGNYCQETESLYKTFHLQPVPFGQGISQYLAR